MTATVTEQAPFFRNLLTREQVLTVYSWAGITAALIPGKDKLTRLCDPNQRITIRIGKSEHRSTYDKPLYLCEHIRY